LTLVGLAIGERLPYPEDITGRAVAAYMYLLIVGSLMGFVAFNWLLGHVSAAKVGTYAYVNPIVAVFVGWAAGEAMSAALIGGIAVILAGVFLVRGGERPCEAVAPAEEPMPTPVAAAVEVGEGQPG
jgi:drug/metabolite transporter (DMT)-like permease